MSDLIERNTALELLAKLPTSIGPGGSALSIPPEVFRRNAQDAIKAIPCATALAEAEAEIARLRGALVFYANEDDWEALRYDTIASLSDEDMGAQLGFDRGEVARAALSRPHATKGEDG